MGTGGNVSVRPTRCFPQMFFCYYLPMENFTKICQRCYRAPTRSKYCVGCRDAAYRELNARYAGRYKGRYKRTPEQEREKYLKRKADPIAMQKVRERVRRRYLEKIKNRAPSQRKPRRGEEPEIKCSACGEAHPRGWFARHGKYPDGSERRSPYCRDCVRARGSARAAARRAAGVPKWKDHGLVRHLLKVQAARCVYCQTSLGYLPTGRVNYHIDHIVPIARGGQHVLENLQLLCAPCNLRKSDKMPSELGGKPCVTLPLSLPP